MSGKDKINQKGTDRDVKPQKGQQSNENWDDKNADKRSSGTTSGRGSDAPRQEDEINTTGVGSSQRSDDQNNAPLESDLEQQPTEKRKDREKILPVLV